MSEYSSLPIDIHCNKLLEWLQNRRHCSKTWQNSVQIVRQKIHAAIKDMPENPRIISLLSGTYITYFHCCEIVDILKETEAETRNMFGRYSSQRMKDWQEIVSMYKQDNHYLADAAEILQRLAVYEIPYIKKQLWKIQSSKEECAKKEENYYKQSEKARQTFVKACKDVGIEGQHIKSELLSLASSLPAYLDRVANDIKDLSNCVKYYDEFRKFCLACSTEEAMVNLATLRFVIERGNLTFYEWKYGKRPVCVELFESSAPAEECTENENEIDFGDLDSAVDIEDGEEINFDICVDESGSTGSLDTNNFQVDYDDGVARGKNALSVLENLESQQSLFIDLYEVQAFLKSRLQCIKNKHPADFLIAQALMSVPDLDKGEEEMSRMLDKVDSVLSKLKEPSKVHLLKIRSSDKYLENLVEELDGKKHQESNYLNMAKLMKQRQKDLEEESALLSSKQKLLIEKTKELQKQVEKEISSKYQGRPVNIIGSIVAAVSS